MMCINSKYNNTITSDLLTSFTIDFFIKCIYMSSLYKDIYIFNYQSYITEIM